jgi:hypothetical protein
MSKKDEKRHDIAWAGHGSGHCRICHHAVELQTPSESEKICCGPQPKNSEYNCCDPQASHEYWDKKVKEDKEFVEKLIKEREEREGGDTK